MTPTNRKDHEGVDRAPAGGRYLVNGRWVDANGEPTDAPARTERDARIDAAASAGLLANNLSAPPAAAGPEALDTPSAPSAPGAGAPSDAPSGASSDALTAADTPANAAALAAVNERQVQAAGETRNLAEFEDALDRVRDVATLDAIAREEAAGKNRGGAHAAIEKRRAELAGEG